MISNRMMFVLQGWLGDSCKLGYGIIVTIDISWAINKNTKHPQLIPQTLDHLHCCLYSTELSAERTCLDGGLQFTIPVNRSLVDEDKDACLNHSIPEVPTMVCIHKKCDTDIMSPRLGHVWRYCLLCIPIEIEPVITCEPPFIDGWVTTIIK